MAKGVSVNFESYKETIPKLLRVIKLDKELMNHPYIVLVPSLKASPSECTSPELMEQILRFCISSNPAAKIIIAAGPEGIDAFDIFEELGYQKLAERYNIGLVDLNNAEFEEVRDNGLFLKFDKVLYPKILKDSFIISIPKLSEDPELVVNSAVSNMLNAFPAKHYKGVFSKLKNKIRKWPIHYSVHDIIQIKMPEFAIIDASAYGKILAGQPFEMDKQAIKLIGKDLGSVEYMGLIDSGLIRKQALNLPQNPQVQPTGEEF